SELRAGSARGTAAVEFTGILGRFLWDAARRWRRRAPADFSGGPPPATDSGIVSARHADYTSFRFEFAGSTISDRDLVLEQGGRRRNLIFSSAAPSSGSGNAAIYLWLNGHAQRGHAQSPKSAGQCRFHFT